MSDSKETEDAEQGMHGANSENGEHRQTQETQTPAENGNPLPQTDNENEAANADNKDTKPDLGLEKPDPCSHPTSTPVDKTEAIDVKTETEVLLSPNKEAQDDKTTVSTAEVTALDDKTTVSTVEVTALDAKAKASEVPMAEIGDVKDTGIKSQGESAMPSSGPSDVQPEIKNGGDVKDKMNGKDVTTPQDKGNPMSRNWSLSEEDHMSDGSESGTEEDQSNFMKMLENFFRERGMEFKPPKFYGEGLNCLKLWRAVTRLGGYDKVTSCKLWRQVGESFKPPKTCTTVSWTFRGFYEKALLDYERYKTNGGELPVPVSSPSEPMNIDNQASGSGRARRDAAARAMQGWHSQRLLGNGEVSDPIIKDKNSLSLQKREKQLKTIGLLKRKQPPYMDIAVKAARTKSPKTQLDTTVTDIGDPAEWVKINVQKTKDYYEVFALVPGLLREEVRVQSDPAGRLVISGDPEHPDNPWGVTPFKKVVSLPTRIDPHQTTAVVTLHGQLYVRCPFEKSE
ncbi:hypothetical protein UlMin_039613 [Ulmus minor]